jgi:hypothetical protein
VKDPAVFAISRIHGLIVWILIKISSKIAAAVDNVVNVDVAAISFLGAIPEEVTFRDFRTRRPTSPRSAAKRSQNAVIRSTNPSAASRLPASRSMYAAISARSRSAAVR